MVNFMINVQKQVTGIGTRFVATVDESDPYGRPMTYVTPEDKLFRCPYEAINHILIGILEYYDYCEKCEETELMVSL